VSREKNGNKREKTGISTLKCKNINYIQKIMIQYDESKKEVA
jgi:hypothetical protein